jgi:hypothetical protein
MKTYIFLFLITLALFSCGPEVSENNGPVPIDTVQVIDTFYVSPEEGNKPTYDRLSADSVRISKVSFQTYFPLFSKLMGKPDSIVDPHYETGWFAEANIPVKVYYYKGSSYHIFRDTAQMQRIDFKMNPDLEFSRNGLRLNSKTTFESMQEYFPESYKSSISEIGDEGHEIKVLFYHGLLHMFFSHGRLYSIEYREPL